MLNFDDVNQYFDFLCEQKLTPEQFAFMYTLLLDKKDKYGRYYIEWNSSSKRPRHTSANVYKYADQVRPWNPNAIQDLVDRGLVYDYNGYTGGSKDSYPDRMEVSQEFAKLVIEPPHVLGEDLWDAYPNFLDVDGKKVRAKTCDKDDLIEKYNKIIQGSRKMHSKVMTALEYDKKYNGITMGIEKYVKSRQWEATIEEMSGSRNIVSNNQNQTEID